MTDLTALETVCAASTKEMEMPRSETIEQAFAFRAVRNFALLALVGLTYGVFAGVQAWHAAGPADQVAFKDIRPVLKAAESAGYEPASVAQAHGDPLLGITLPRRVKRYLDQGTERPVFATWVRPLSEARKQDFITNLEGVLAAAEHDGADPIATTHVYKDLKLDRVQANPLGELTEQLRLVAAVSLLLACLALMGLFSLVLVLLSVERNTRERRA
jgi:hypothetical protein